jgi:two-component system NarL family sensor kinase
LALLRLLLLPIVLVAEELIDRSRMTSAFEPIYVLACLYAALTVIASLTGRDGQRLARIELLADFAFLCALDLSSGGPYSQVRKVFFVLPLAGAATLRPRYTAALGLLAVGGFLIVSLPHPDARDPGGGQYLIVETLILIWTGAAATMLAWRLAAGQARIAALASDRGRLLAQTLDAVQRERKRLAYQLHDESLQNVLAALWDLYPIETPDRKRHDAALHALELTVTQLRNTIFRLQPLTLDREGLRSAVRQLAQHQAARTGATIDVFIDSAAVGAHDQLVYEVVRELLANAVQHAHAASIEITIERQGDQLTIEVADDGLGIPQGRLDEARSDGHLGLAATTDRVSALDGKLTIETVPGRGTTVTANLPAPPSRPSTQQQPSKTGDEAVAETPGHDTPHVDTHGTPPLVPLPHALSGASSSAGPAGQILQEMRSDKRSGGAGP